MPAAGVEVDEIHGCHPDTGAIRGKAPMKAGRRRGWTTAAFGYADAD